MLILLTYQWSVSRVISKSIGGCSIWNVEAQSITSIDSMKVIQY